MKKQFTSPSIEPKIAHVEKTKITMYESKYPKTKLGRTALRLFGGKPTDQYSYYLWALVKEPVHSINDAVEDNLGNIWRIINISSSKKYIYAECIRRDRMEIQKDSIETLEYMYSVVANAYPGEPFYLHFENPQFFREDAIYMTNNHQLKVLKDPFRRWYQLLWQWITFGKYKADYVIKVKLIR